MREPTATQHQIIYDNLEYCFIEGKASNEPSYHWPKEQIIQYALDKVAALVLGLEDNAPEMIARHKVELATLQATCPHLETTVVTSHFEQRTTCKRCGKLVKRERDWSKFIR